MENSRYEVSFEPGETIFKQGSSATHTVTLTSGIAKQYLEGKHRNIILNLLKSQDFFGGLGIYVDQRHHYTVKAVTSCTSCFMDANIFKKYNQRKQGVCGILYPADEPQGDNRIQ
ncbi:MAG: cyclic nucleotide-binding domain-containing protein [Bacteroidales bacterium]|nr:cyclic nucleotide-binding domain-containing protein [Bacteroidales bacterium]